jgi:hypothetical protein
MKTTTDYTDCTDYLAKATIILDFTDSCVPSVASGKAERATRSNQRRSRNNQKNLCNQNL